MADDGTGTSPDPCSSKKSCESDAFRSFDKQSISSDIGDKLSIEELWELSQVFVLIKELDPSFILISGLLSLKQECQC